MRSPRDTAAVYADGMQHSCALDNGGNHFAVRHNPWPYNVDEQNGRRRHDVPFSGLGDAISAGILPNVGLVVPDLCSDAHDCDLSVADDWSAA